MRKIVELNIQALMHMSHLIMPQMVAKGRGIVINMSSGSAIKPTVMLMLYASTKVSIIIIVVGLLLLSSKNWEVVSLGKSEIKEERGWN